MKHVTFDTIVTVCDHAYEACPIFRGKMKVVHVGFPTRLGLPGVRQGRSDEEAMQHDRRVRDQIRLLVEHRCQRRWSGMMKTKSQRQADGMINVAEPLRRFVRRRVNDPHAADDIVQDVLLKALANRDSVPPDERLAAWMYRAAHNAIIDRYRERKIEPITDEPAVDSAEKSEVLIELAACLRCMLERLEDPYRDALKLADLQGLAQQTIADQMGISLSGAKSRVQRARQQLQAMFAACCQVQRDVRGNVTEFHPSDRAGQSCSDKPCGSCD